MKKKKVKQKIREFDSLQPEEKQVLISFRDYIESLNDDEPIDIDDTLLERFRSSPHFFLAVLDEIGGIPTQTAARVLISLQAFFIDKQSKKAIKKALFRLKQRGVLLAVSEDTEKSSPIYKQVEKNEAYGMVSTVDTFGDRLAFLAVPQRPHVWMLGGGVIGDETGMRQFSVTETNRSSINGFFRDVNSSSQTPLARIDADHAGALFLECAHGMEKQGMEIPADFLELKSWISANCKPIEKPAVYDIFSEEDVRSKLKLGLLSQGISLYDNLPFSAWYIPREEIEKYIRKIEKAKNTTIILSKAQQSQMINDIIRQAVQELYPSERRMLMRRRLEECAYVLHELGKEEDAELALAAALDITNEIVLLKENEFLLELLKRSINLIEASEEEEKQEDKKPGIIIP